MPVAAMGSITGNAMIVLDPSINAPGLIWTGA
jgi:hypothetical protein